MKEFIKSPLNYTGGKYDLLPELVKIFPENINTFVDVFGGGFNVGINVKAQHIIYNDINQQLCDLIVYFRKTSINNILNEINSLILYYNLSKGNKEGYLKLREDYNDYPTSIKLYVLSCFSFCYQIRFNKKGKFNMPCGNREFSENMKNNLINFKNKLDKISFQVSNLDYTKLDYEKFNKKDLFLYLDCPYLISTATYNENGGWNENEEKRFLNWVQLLKDKNIKFALSNVLVHRGKVNLLLNEFLSKNKDLNIIKIENKKYKNNQYHGKVNTNDTEEVVITNYENK